MAIRPYEDWLGIPGSTERPNHYELLGVAPDDLNEQLLKAAYGHRYAMVRCYEVGNYGDEATRLLREMTVAYDVLRDSARRQSYDAELARAAERSTDHDTGSARDTLAEAAGPVERSQKVNRPSGQQDASTTAGSIVSKASSSRPQSKPSPPLTPAAQPVSAGNANPSNRAPATVAATDVKPKEELAKVEVPGGPTAIRVTAKEPVAVASSVPSPTQRFVVVGGGALLLGCTALVLGIVFFSGNRPSSPPKPAPHEHAFTPSASSASSKEPASAGNSLAPATDDLQPTAAVIQFSGELRKVTVVSASDGEDMHLLLVPIQGDPVEAYVRDAAFAEQLWDIPATVELGKSGPIVQVSGHWVEQDAFSPRFEEARRWLQIERLQAPQGSAEVGKTRSTYSLPETHRDDLHRLRKVDEQVELTAYLETEPTFGRTPPYETVIVVLDRHYLVELPAAWRDPLLAHDVDEPLTLTAVSTGRFANRDGRELPLLRGLTLASAGSASNAPAQPTGDAVAQATTPTRNEVPTPGPSPVMTRPESASTPESSASSSPAEPLGDSVELPPREVLEIETLGELPWSGSDRAQLALDSRCAALPAGSQLMIEAIGSQRFRVVLLPGKQMVAGFMLEHNQLKFVWSKTAPAEASQLRNCRLQIADGNEQRIVQLRHPIRTNPIPLPNTANDRQLALQVRDIPDRSKLILVASVEYDGTPVDAKATGQQLKFGIKRNFAFKDMSQLGDFADAVGVELRLGANDEELILIVSPNFSRPPFEQELTEDGLREGLESAQRAFNNAQQDLVKSQQRLLESRNSGGNPKAKSARIQSAINAVNAAQANIEKAIYFQRNVAPQLHQLAGTLRNSVSIRFRVTATVDDAVIVLHDGGFVD